MLTALRNRFGLLTNDLLNDGIDAMMNVLFPNTLRRSRSVTPLSSILQEDLYFTNFDDWSYLPPLLAEPRDDHEFELLKDGLNLPPAYFENGKFPFVQQRSHDVPMSFTKYGRSVASANLCADYAVHK
ncbi:26455_t:CDS:1, partial [Gigaspora margarita]